MGDGREDEPIRKGDLIKFLQKLAITYKDLQYLYRERTDYNKEVAIINAIADYVYWMKPYNSNDMKED